MIDIYEKIFRRLKMKLTYISILRSLSILVVVFFHVYQYMYVPRHFPETVQMYHDAYFWFNQCVGINIAMPMFTLIAGFLFSYFYDKGKYQEFVPLIKKKAMRLLLPFFVFGILMMATTGVPFKPWELYTGGFAHLWYLSFLFWCFPLWMVYKEIHEVVLCACFHTVSISFRSKPRKGFTHDLGNS